MITDSQGDISYDAFWDEQGCVLEASGQIRESSVFGPNLVLRRRIIAILPAVRRDER